MQRVHFQVRFDVFNCQQILAKISFVIFDIVITKTNRMWVSVALVKFLWFGINWHVFNQFECRNCCLYVVIQKIAPQAKSGKYFQIWFFPRFGGKKWRMRMQVILDSSFARPGSAPIWGGKKGEFRDWTTDTSAKGHNYTMEWSRHNGVSDRETSEVRQWMLCFCSFIILSFFLPGRYTKRPWVNQRGHQNERGAGSFFVYSRWQLWPGKWVRHCLVTDVERIVLKAHNLVFEQYTLHMLWLNHVLT